MKTTITFTIFWGILLGGLNAEGYVLNHTKKGQLIRWHRMTIDVHLNKNSHTKVPLNLLEQIVARSIWTWQQALQDLKTLRYMGLTEQKEGFHQKFKGQNQNVVLWKRDRWPYGQKTMALTITSYNHDTGEILDADIIFNGVNYRWDKIEEEPPPSSQKNSQQPIADIENTLTHELGHLLGLEHSKNPQATMYFSTKRHETTKRSLHQDDIEGIHKLYSHPRKTHRSTQTKDLQQKEKDIIVEIHGMGCSTLKERSPVHYLGNILFFSMSFFFIFLKKNRRKKNSF